MNELLTRLHYKGNADLILYEYFGENIKDLTLPDLGMHWGSTNPNRTKPWRIPIPRKRMNHSTVIVFHNKKAYRAQFRGFKSASGASEWYEHIGFTKL